MRIIPAHHLEIFCKKFTEKTTFNFNQLEKNDIDPSSTVYKKFITNSLELTLFDHGYVMMVEGDIKQSIRLLVEIDEALNRGAVYFISPSQRVENSEESRFPRGASENEIARFLDSQFRNKEYTGALAN